MGDRHDYVALEWVKGEIAETLKQARQALEAYVESPADPTQMGFCLTYVHQVHGTLQMVEFFGAALLAEEMEQLARALLEERVANRTESLEVLMQSILQLPAYLDRIQSARRDLPMVVLPLLNDLRAARGEKLLSETSLFAPDLSSRLPALPRESVERLRTETCRGCCASCARCNRRRWSGSFATRTWQPTSAIWQGCSSGSNSYARTRRSRRSGRYPRRSSKGSPAVALPMVHPSERCYAKSTVSSNVWSSRAWTASISRLRKS